MKYTFQLIPLFLLATLAACHPAAAAAKPLQIYILAGQSNMQGQAKVSTFEHIGMPSAASCRQWIKEHGGEKLSR